MHARIYARFSTDRQNEATIADQVRACRDYAAAHALDVVDVYTDEGISGAAAANRPGLQSLIASTRSGEVVILADLSRLSRAPADLAPILRRWAFDGVRVVGIQDGFDSTSATADLQAGISGIMSQATLQLIGRKTHSALTMRARDGKPTGGRAYGFTAGGELVEPEAAIVREIFARYAGGATLLSIASDLNARGVPAAGAAWDRTKRRADGRWLVSALHAMLRNERYVGRVVWNRSRWVKAPDGRRVRRERPPSEWIVSEGPAIVDRPTWDAVQARHAARHVYSGGAGAQAQYLLSGILECALCGSKLVITGSKGRTYYCSSHRHGGAAACPNGLGARRDVAESILLPPIHAVILSDEAVAHAVDFIRRTVRLARMKSGQSPDEQLRELDARAAKIEGAIAAGILDREDVAAALADLDARRAAVQRSGWRRAADDLKGIEAKAERAYRDQVERARAVLTGADLRAAQTLLRQIVGGVPCRPADGGGYLVATLGVDLLPLLAAGGCIPVGSGGAQWSRVHCGRFDLYRRAA